MSILVSLQQNAQLSALSVHFARFIARTAGLDEDHPVVLTAAALSQRNQQGDVCLPLAELAGQALFPQAVLAESTRAPALQSWCETLLNCRCVGVPGERAPMILDRERLYLHRFWRHETAVAQALLQRLQSPPPIDAEGLQSALTDLFPANAAAVGPDWQKLASALAVLQRFVVISGGPGTGKTTTVVKVLSLLLAQQPTLRIGLAAPTGKAAARMVESMRSVRRSLALAPVVQAALPDAASTLHRLLGWQPDLARYPYRHQRDNPLPLDCLVIDEASMIDLPLMHAVLDALPAEARLILLGDRDQLASVEAGNVLGDMTGHGRVLACSSVMRARLQALGVDAAQALPTAQAVAPIQDTIAILRHSHRFAADSGIGRLARLVNAGDAAQALALLEQSSAAQAAGAPGDLLWLRNSTQPRSSVPREALEWALRHYSQYLVQTDVHAALSAFARARILCAAHEGPLGEVEFNRQVEAALRRQGLLEPDTQGHGTPVMVTANDYELQLYNGDIGLLWRSAQGRLEACFPQLDGKVRRLPAASLPPHDVAWAMTVHKSQGSEFDEVLLVLPTEADSPLLLRELLYTGITRARQRLLLLAGSDAFARSCVSPARRSSGLAARLGWPDD
jgi:exodeoxyribonuclease V alpha subunit